MLRDPQTGEQLDQVILVKYVAPASYTGEDLVEITCHGGMYIIERILSVFITQGAQYATRGEFTLRAFTNGKMNLSTAESVQELISSRSEIQHKIALNAYTGAYQEILEALKRDIFNLISALEAQIEFPEEEDISKSDLTKQQDQKLVHIIASIQKELHCREHIKRIDEGIRIVIAGRPNVGKSSLFNFLLQKERSLVHWESGTTRDYISEQVLINGVDVELIDTAGIRDGVTPVESMGIEKARELIGRAHLVLLVCATDIGWSEWEATILETASMTRTVVILNKCDLHGPAELEQKLRSLDLRYQSISLSRQINTAAVAEVLESEVARFKRGDQEGSLIINQRQEVLMKRILEHLTSALANSKSALEITAEYLKQALIALEEFCGTTTSEEILNNIFSKFCIGK